MGNLETNVVKGLVRAVRRANAEACVNLVRRRKWYDEKPEDNTDPATQEGTTPENVGGDGNKPASDGMVQMTQAALDKIMGDRASQAKRSLLKDLGVEDVDSLKSIVEARKQAEEAQTAVEEANKTELEKRDEQLAASVLLQTKQAETIKNLHIESAIKDIAPAKEVPASHFAALLKLMDKSTITVTEGIVDVESVGKALDATLEANPFLKAPDNKPNGFGSPVRSNKPPVKQTNQPVKPTKKYSI